MERIQFINRDRVRWCCADLGITPEQLAGECGISQSTMARFLTEDGGLTFNQLKRIAEYFGRGVLFFLEKDPVEPEQVHTPQFRTLANRKPQLSARLRAFIERVESQRDVYLSLLEDMDDAEYPRFLPPDLADRAPAAAAAIARKWLGLDLRQNSTFDSYREAVEARGILVFRSNGYAGKWQIAKESPILGFSLYDPVCPVIVVKKQDWDTRQTFTLMHELGHVLLHSESWIDDESDFQSLVGAERDANSFAGLVLVPDQALAEIDDRARPADPQQFDDWLFDLRRRLGVSAEVILRRLLNVGRLPQSEYDAYRAHWQSVVFQAEEGGNRKYRHREPMHVFGDRYVRTVLGALEAGQITLARASGYLDSLKIKDVRQLEQFYARL